MSRYILAPQAWADLDDIQTYLLSERPAAAPHVMSGLRRAMDLVAENPGIGRQSRLGASLLRVWVVWSWAIIYDDSGDAVEIVRVLHGARDLEHLFD